MKRLFETGFDNGRSFWEMSLCDSTEFDFRKMGCLNYALSGRWSIRFNDLLRLMPKMTHATLSVQLKTLVENGLVERKQYESIPPKVEYSLTEIGKKFHPVIEAMHNWGQEYIEFMKKDNE